MSKKRRDNRNRILHQGESQRSDGRYTFKYTDQRGRNKYVYSWRLDKNDRNPQGKKNDLSLREKERMIEADLFHQIIPLGDGLKVIDLVKRYLSLKVGVRHNTEANYKFVLHILEKEEFGKQKIDKVKPSDAKVWLIQLQKDGKGYSTIKSVRGVVKPAFQMAEADGLIRKNPFDFPLSTVVVNDSVTREAITRKQEREFLSFIQQDKHFCKYYDGIYILFHTGLRISEFVGLTISDLDFKGRKIRVDHQLQRKRTMEYVVEKPKTAAGVREIPMSEDVFECFQRILAERKAPKVEPMINGYAGFLFLDKNGMPMVALHWEKYFLHIVRKYNSIYKVPLPEITPHVCRHTFCSNMAKSGMNPKTLQYIMGHSDISVTLNIYTHVGFEDVAEELERVMRRGEA